MTDPLVRETLERLDYLDEAWPSLVSLGVEPSNRSRSSPSRRLLADEAAARMSREIAEAMADRRRPGWVYIPVNTHPSLPLDVEVLDLYVAVLSTAEDLAATVTQTAGCERPRHVESAWEDPRPRLRLARAWLTAAQEADERTVPWVLDQVLPLVRRVAAALGEIVDGQVLDALCPWCDGRTTRRPTGGDRTLVVQAPESGPRIVCCGENCTPPLSSCGMKVKGQPAWPEREWDWLAKQLRPVS